MFDAFAVLAIIIFIAVTTFVTASILGPRKMPDDVMKESFGDVPHIGGRE